MDLYQRQAVLLAAIQPLPLGEARAAMRACASLWAAKGLAQVIKHENEGPAFSLSLTKVHSLRHRLVRSRQSAHEDVAGFLRF